MFIVYHSNKLEFFTRLVTDVMSNYRLSDPMISEVILIENKITEKWIEIQLSNYFGISANVMFMSIKSFIRKISADMLCIDEKINDISYDVMYWELMHILPESSINPNCSIIQKYLYNDVNNQKCGQFSMHLTNLFLEYLIYRSDWLNAWKTHKIVNNLAIEHQLWQSEIWRMFLLRNAKNVSIRCTLLEDYAIFLQNNDKQLNFDRLPKRIFIYSVKSTPLIYWKILYLLSYHIDIYLWVINPNINNWANFVNENTLLNLQQKKDDLYKNNYLLGSLESFRKKNNQSLLKFWTDLNSDTCYSINQLKDIFSIKALTIPKTNSMLHVVQKDILEDRFFNQVTNIIVDQSNFRYSKINQKRYVIKSEDQSITMHQCHHIQREIEILYNNLLLMLSDDPALLPGEIIVMAPNIYHYESIIKSIFSDVFNRKLPYSISGRRKYTCSIISSILKILDIWRCRFTSEEILSLLSVSSIILKFNITAEEIKLIRIWIIESGIRWGLDQKTLKTFDIPATDQNTWYFGLRRMLLGYAINRQNKLWENIHPYIYVNDEYTDTFIKLGNFLNILTKWRNRLSQVYLLKEWIPYMQEIIDDFFDCTHLNVEENKDLFLLKNYWIDILQTGIKSGYSKKIHIVVLSDQLQSKLNKTKIHCNFSPNVINFCDITPVCGLPCKVLCIIGMNNDSFPRILSSCDFNLILKEKRVGDNDIYKQECDAFLLTCLLPKDRLYISFINSMTYHNQDIKNSSILIDKLLECIAQNFYLKGDQNLNILDNVKRLRQYLCKQYSCIPFDLHDFIINSTKESLSKKWRNGVCINNIHYRNKGYIYDFSTSLLPKISNTIILFQDLYNFYRHPIRTWFQKRLGVYFDIDKNQKLINDEPFFVDDIDRFLLNTKLVDYIIHNKNTDELYQESYASGIIPYGSFGKLYWCDQYEKMSQLSNKIKMYYSDDVYKIDINLMCNKIKLTGQLQVVQKNGLIRWKAATVYMKDCFLLWLEHVIYCAVGGKGDSRLFGTNDVWHFPNFSRFVARHFLFRLIDGYCIGMNTPLMLLYRSGGIWINYMFNWQNKTMYSDQIIQKKSRKQLIKSWQGYNGSYISRGEYYDPYFKKLLPFYLDEEHIQNIINTAKHYFLSIMQNRML